MQEILIGGQNGIHLIMDAAMGNRHGMISGATGTGKTITLQILAEGFSKIGVPVFLADIKGDLSGITVPGQPHEKISERVQQIVSLIFSIGVIRLFSGTFLPRPDIRCVLLFQIWGHCCSAICWS